MAFAAELMLTLDTANGKTILDAIAPGSDGFRARTHRAHSTPPTSPARAHWISGERTAAAGRSFALCSQCDLPPPAAVPLLTPGSAPFRSVTISDCTVQF